MNPTQNFPSKIRFFAVVLGSLLASALAPLAHASAGHLDPTFGIGGKVLTDFAGNADTGWGMALQPDGKIVAAGESLSGAGLVTGDFALARYNADGTIDSTFGVGGKVTTDFAANEDMARAVAVLADNKIVAAGLSQSATGIDFALARYNSDGSLDSSFGTDGNGKVRTVFPGGISRIYAIAIQDDQKIVAAGRVASTTNVYDFALARYNTDGTLDTTFGINGLVTTDFGAGETARALAIQMDHKIVAAGYNAHFLLIRYNADGSLDTTFGPDGTGKVTTDFADNGDIIQSIALQTDQKIVAGGLTFTDFLGIDSSFALARYLPDGSLDPAFGSGGKVTTDFSSSGDGAYEIVIEADGSIIAGGYATPGNDTDFALARYHSDGSLDAHFGVGGKVMTDSGGNDLIHGIALQSDGKLIASGSGGPNADFALARYATIPGALLLNISTRLNVLTDDNVLIGGFIITGSDPKKVIVRAIGPSLPLNGGTNALADPVLELHEPDGTIVTNDNWRETQEQEIIDSTIPPANDLESAIVAILEPGSYTAIVRGQNGGTGIALVEAYDLDQAAASQLANISTRGFVDTGDDVLIGGLIIGSDSGADASVLVRAIGPSLTSQGVPGALQDPYLELHNGDGDLTASNDDWKDSQQAEIETTTIPPMDDRESALVATLAAGNYTAIVRGAGATTGVGLVEVYDLP